MRFMGWTWDEYWSNPQPVIDRLIANVTREAQEREANDSAVMGPNEARQMR